MSQTTPHPNLVPRRPVPPCLAMTLALLLPWATAAGLPPRLPDDAAVRDALRARVEHLRLDPGQRVHGDRVLAPRVVATFFEGRAFAPAWSGGDRVAQALAAIRGVEEDGLTPAHYHLAAIERARDGVARGGGPAAVAELDILVADALAAVLDHVRFGKVRPASLDPNWNVDPRLAAPPLETLLEFVAEAPSVTAGLERFAPTHFVYTGLKQALARYRAIAASGGWATVPPGPTLKPGVTDPRVASLRARLAATGELPASAASESPVFEADVETAVKLFQESHRLTPDGAVGRGTLEALNVDARATAAQVRVNLERARWVLPGLRDTFVLVNLPAFKAYFIRERRNVWETRTQIGQTARKTRSFRADLTYLVLNPDWTVPPTILAQDVLDPMRRGEDAIRRKGLQVIDRQGRRVDPAQIDWATARPSTFPYTLRQAPGRDNALGRVKFIFPNEHSIFLHDTPSRELFAADRRTFSSGCIRLEHALDFARLLLEDLPEWPAERFDQAVASDETRTVFLPEPIPVLIVYWTASVGASGDVRFARDVYGLDPALLRALDAPPEPAR